MSGFYEEVNVHQGEDLRLIINTGATSVDENTVITAVVDTDSATVRQLESYPEGWIEVEVSDTVTSTWTVGDIKKLQVKLVFSNGDVAKTEYVRVVVLEGIIT